eukprot:COSAG04_NODE_2700_length_3713_cov_2.832042_4_plen_77_part_00
MSAQKSGVTERFRRSAERRTHAASLFIACAKIRPFPIPSRRLRLSRLIPRTSSMPAIRRLGRASSIAASITAQLDS